MCYPSAAAQSQQLWQTIQISPRKLTYDDGSDIHFVGSVIPASRLPFVQKQKQSSAWVDDAASKPKNTVSQFHFREAVELFSRRELSLGRVAGHDRVATEWNNLFKYMYLKHQTTNGIQIISNLVRLLNRVLIKISSKCTNAFAIGFGCRRHH